MLFISTMHAQNDSLCEFTMYKADQSLPTVGSTSLSMRSHWAAIGATNMLDTYLSNETYNGFELRYLYETQRKLKCNGWSRYTQHEADISKTHNRADNCDMIGGNYHFRIGWMKTLPLNVHNLNIHVGGGAEAGIGFLYNTRNQNNPAQLKTAINIKPRVKANYCFFIKNKPFAVEYDVTAPLVGLMFSPNYGQSYYEIFTRGNYDHNIVPITIVSTPSLRQMISLRFTLWKTDMSIGYLNDIQQSKVNNLKTHTYSHLFVIGIHKLLEIKRHRP